MEKVGIKVKPVLLSTRNNGFATKIFPVISEFNYLIVQATIDGKTYLLDTTDDYLSFGELPFRCLNEYARLLDFKEGSWWIDIEPINKSSILFNVEVNFDEQQNLIGNVKSKATGYHALNTKKSYYQNKANYIKNLEDNSPFIEINNHAVSSNGKTSPDFSESYKVEYNENETGETLFLNPFLIKFFNENPFKLQERTYPIDFGYKDNYIYMFELNFGETHSVLEKPKDVILNLPNNTGQITLSTNVLDNSINIIMKIDFNESIYPPEYYPYLKEFMGKIVDIQKKSLIVLKKI